MPGRRDVLPFARDRRRYDWLFLAYRFAASLSVMKDASISLNSSETSCGKWCGVAMTRCRPPASAATCFGECGDDVGRRSEVDDAAELDRLNRSASDDLCRWPVDR